MALIAGLGTEFLSYNNIAFTIYKSNVSARPIMDSSGRTTKWVEFTISVERAMAEPFPGQTTTDTAMSEIRRRLSENGGPLFFEGKGYGPLNVNTGDGVLDCNFGPKVELLEWFGGIGSGPMAIVSWKVTTAVPQCEAANFAKSLAEFCYTVEHRIDIDGYSTIATSGHFLIPMTRTVVNGVLQRTLSDHADNYREACQTKVPIGFQRQNQSFKFNEAKTRCDFSWEDASLRTPLPEGCTQCKITHNAESAFPHVVWEQSLRGSITVPQNVDKSFALKVFLSIVSDRLVGANDASLQQRNATIALVQARLNAANDALAAGANGPNAAVLRQFRNRLATDIQAGGLVIGPGQVVGIAQNALAIIPRKFSVSNDISGRGVNFDYSYRAIFRRDIETAVSINGVWRPYPLSLFNTWRQSMEKLQVTDVRGVNEVAWSQNDDALIDLCINAKRPSRIIILPEVANQRELDDVVNAARAANPGVPLVFRNVPPFAEVNNAAGEEDLDPARLKALSTLPQSSANWLSYDNQVIYKETRGRYARHRPLAGQVKDPKPSFDPSRVTAKAFQTARGTVQTANQTVPDILQEINAPPAVVYLQGSASRIGLGIPLPNLLTVSGRVAKRNRVLSTSQHVVAKMGDLPVFAATWLLEYLLALPPTGSLPVLVDPILGIDGGDI